jgi:transposase InsO family protein
VEVISWLDDCTRYALHVTAHARVTIPIVLATFREALARHGIPASTLTDNGMVYTVRLAGHGRQGGRNSFEAELGRRHIVQKNSRPGHPTTCGKAERFQQTMKKWLRAQPVQPSTIAELQTLVGAAAPICDSRSRGLIGQRGHDGFVLDGGQSTESGLASSAVVGPFDPRHDGDAELLAVGPLAAVEDVALEQAEEALHSRVVAG